MLKNDVNSPFGHIQDEQLRDILARALGEMASLLEETKCLSAVSIADELNAIKKRAFEELYAIGRETLELDRSEEVLKAIRALQDAFAQIIQAIAPMDALSHNLRNVWLAELTNS